MLSIGANMHMAFAAPAFAARAPAAHVRLTTSLMSDVDDWSAPQATKPTSMDTTGMVGKVVPTGGMAAPADVAAPVEPTTVGPAEFIKLGAFDPSPRPTRLTWNPKSLAVPALPQQAELFSKQFQPNYLKVAPDYLDGTLPGDQGFDPWALMVLASPPLSPDGLQALDAKSRTAAERDARMTALSLEEQRAKLLWMRSSELKHGRLAMLAVAGWPMAELLNGGFLRDNYTGGRAPSLFNGHLLDYAPFMLAFLGAMAAIEFTTKDTAKDGDYNFDPLGFAKGIGAMRTLQVAEIKHGRAAMMAITGFAVQECLYGSPVVQQTPFFFLPFGGFGL